MCSENRNSAESGCDCFNCKELSENAIECDICVEPFWENGISSCYTCGSLICFRCVQKLVSCPFCRVSVVYPWQRNVAIEKLIKRLKLPCRYSKKGCKKWLQQSSRDDHEQTCEFAPISCPLTSVCSWRGADIDEISAHLKETHSVTLLNGDKVTVEIPSLLEKVQETEKHLSKYAVMVRCYSSFFCCKIVLFERKLKIVFTEVYSAQSSNRKYVVWLELLNSKPIAKSILEISKNVRCNKQIDISCDNLLSSTESCSSPVENNLKILINIQPLK